MLLAGAILCFPFVFVEIFDDRTWINGILARLDLRLGTPVIAYRSPRGNAAKDGAPSTGSGEHGLAGSPGGME